MLNRIIYKTNLIVENLLKKLFSLSREDFLFFVFLLFSFFITLFTYKYGLKKSLVVELFAFSVFSMFYNFGVGLVLSLYSISMFEIPPTQIITLNIPLPTTFAYLLIFIVFGFVFIKTKFLTKVEKKDLIVVFLYSSLIIFYSILGFLKGGLYRYDLKPEFVLFMMWNFAILLTYSFKNEKEAKIVFYGTILFVIILDLIIFQAYLRKAYSLGPRIYTRQAFIYSMIMPYLFAWLLLEKKKSIKIFLAILFFVSIIAMLITLTRTIVIGLLISFFIIFMWWKRFSLKTLIQASIATGVFTGILYKIITLNPMLYKRFYEKVVYFYKDWSFLLRIIVGYDTIMFYGKKLLIGMGIAHPFAFRPGLFEFTWSPWIDIAYLAIMGKIGILGLSFMLYFLIRPFVLALKVYYKIPYKQKEFKILALGTIGFVPSFLLENLMFSIMIKYIFFYAALILLSLFYFYYKEYKDYLKN